VENVALGQVFFPGKLFFPLSVAFHQYYIVSSLLWLLLEGQAGAAFELSKDNSASLEVGNIGRTINFVTPFRHELSSPG
jgi:hypothetical protein